jgi:ACR3 family arsenite transporter
MKNDAPLGFFEHYLTLWVGLSIVMGVFLGSIFPSFFHFIATLEIANINIVVAILIWVMIYPMMVNIDFSTIRDIVRRPKGLVITFIINWFVKPFSMALLGGLFLEYIFGNFIAAEEAKEYIAGLILLGTAPCTAMVFVWSRLVRGDATYTVVQVSLNDLVMIFAYAPIVTFLLGLAHIKIPWETLLLSVLLYVVLPVGLGYLTRRIMEERTRTQFLNKIKSVSVLGLLATVVLLFAFQAHPLLNKPIIIALISIPILLQSILMFILTYFWMYKVNLPHNVAGPAALIGGSNFFELAVAVAISLFGLGSGAVLAVVVGVLVEVPIMLFLVRMTNKSEIFFINNPAINL